MGPEIVPTPRTSDVSREKKWGNSAALIANLANCVTDDAIFL